MNIVTETVKMAPSALEDDAIVETPLRRFLTSFLHLKWLQLRLSSLGDSSF